MQASVILKCLRPSLVRSANALQTTALSRFSIRPLLRSFNSRGTGVPSPFLSPLSPPLFTTLAGPSSDSLAASQPCKSSPTSSSSVSITLLSDGVNVCYNGQTAFVPLRWLRDHCTSPAVYDAKTNSRLTPIPLSPDDWVPRDIAFDSAGACLCITWQDGRKSSFAADWLAATVLPQQLGCHVAPSGFLKDPPVSWEGQPLFSTTALMSEENFPTVSSSALAHPSGVLRACSHLHRYGAVFIDELEASEIATRTMIERFGVLRNSMFGSFWTFEANGAMDDLAYTNSNIPPHTDGTYFEDAPGLQIFHCISGSYSGGITSLVDGFAVADRMRAQNADAFALLCNLQLPFRYIGDGYHLFNRTHVFTLNDTGRVAQFRYNNCDRAPLDAATLVPVSQTGAPIMSGAITYERVYDALQQLHRLLDDAAMKVQFKLAPGKAIVINNRRVLHARSEFVGTRRLCGAYVQQEEWMGRVRHLISASPQLQ